MSSKLNEQSPRTREQHPPHLAFSHVVLNTMAEGLYTVDIQGLVTYINPSAERMFGWSEAELLGKKMHDVTHYKHSDGTPFPASDCPGLQVLQKGIELREHPDVFIRKDGSFLRVIFNASPLVSDGKNVGMLVIFRDESQRWLAEEELRRSEEQFRVLANSLPELCWMAQGDGYIFWYNERWYEYTGTRPEQMQGWGWQSVHDPELLPAVVERWKVSLQTGQPFEMEFPLRGADEKFHWFLTRVKPLHDAKGNVVGWCGVNTNIDEQRRVRQSLLDSRQELENRVLSRTAELNVANDNLRELSGQILRLQDEERRRIARDLHDSVGQVLAAIGMNFDILRCEKLSPRASFALSDSQQLADQALAEIRTISHLLHPPLLEVAGLAAALRDYVAGFSKRSQIKVDLLVPEKFGRLSTEMEITIFRVVQECLTNIHKHSGSAMAQIRIVHDRTSIAVEVKDAGKGIPFTKQLELRSYGSTGVGFRGMRERLRQLGGSLEIKSDVEGTAVVATLPLAHAASAVASSETVQ